jgi:arginase
MRIGVIGAPFDLGAKRRGVDMGPSAIRIAKLTERLEHLGHSVKDYGNIPATDMAAAKVGDARLRYLDPIIAGCRLLAASVSACVSKRLFPLVLGGDQSTSIGTLAGLAQGSNRRGMIWIDAHADFNTHLTTPSGNIHGMALAAILGYGHPRLAHFGKVSPKALEANTVLVAGREFDKGEARALERSKVSVFTMRDIDELGMRKVMEVAIRTAARGVKDVHLSFDIDAMDPKEAPGTGTPVSGGLSYREAHLAMEMLSDSGAVTSAEFVEVNPVLDVSNRSAEVTVDLITSLFGKRIMRRR